MDYSSTLPATDRPEAGSGRPVHARWWIGVALAAGTGAAIALPLSTGLLKYPWWFAIQRVCAILVPAAVGWYWARRRPDSGFVRPLLALSVCAVPLGLEAATSPWLRTIGVLSEAPLLFATFVVVVAFPTGRLCPFKRILFAPLALCAVSYIPWTLLTARPVGGPLTACAALCPHNPLQIQASAGVVTAAGHLYDGLGLIAAIGAAIALAVDLERADPLRRRTLLIGSGAAVMFLLAFALYAGAGLFKTPPGSAVNTPIRWVLPAARAILPLGYLAALVAAELYAGRLMTGIVDKALRSASVFEVIRTLPRAIGDPQLSFGFWVDGRGWLRADGEPFIAPEPDSGRVMTTVRREGRPLAAVVYRAQLEETPEVIKAIVAASLLITENATLEAELHAAIGELRQSRARLIRAGDAERRRIERDLHDGAQQRLIALRFKLQSSADTPVGDRGDRGDRGRGHLAELCADVDEALTEIRELAQGVFPQVLADRGLLAGLRAVALSSPLSVRIDAALPSARYPADLEAALYFCALEALQNASKHAGPAAQVSIAIAETDGELHLCVRDDGVGFDPDLASAGSGLTGMRDRLGAFGGRLSIEAAPGSGAVIHAAIPLAATDAAAAAEP